MSEGGFLISDFEELHKSKFNLNSLSQIRNPNSEIRNPKSEINKP